MTVRELMALLSEQPPDAPVAAHGCDCAGFVEGLRVTDGVVNLLRDKAGHNLDTSYDMTMQDAPRVRDGGW